MHRAICHRLWYAVTRPAHLWRQTTLPRRGAVRVPCRTPSRDWLLLRAPGPGSLKKAALLRNGDSCRSSAQRACPRRTWAAGRPPSASAQRARARAETRTRAQALSGRPWLAVVCKRFLLARFARVVVPQRFLLVVTCITAFQMAGLPKRTGTGDNTKGHGIASARHPCRAAFTSQQMNTLFVRRSHPHTLR